MRSASRWMLFIGGVLVLCVMLAACGDGDIEKAHGPSALAPVPTYTPLPTHTSYPTYTPALSPSPSIDCEALVDYLDAMEGFFEDHGRQRKRWNHFVERIEDREISRESVIDRLEEFELELNDFAKRVRKIDPPREAREAHALVLQMLEEGQRGMALLQGYHKTGNEADRANGNAALDESDRLRDEYKYEIRDLMERCFGPLSTATPSQDLSGCELSAAFVRDVTVPDGTVFEPGESFVKTWELKNTSDCDWEGGLILQNVEDPQRIEPIPKVAAGETFEISVSLEAPSTPGEYRSEWQICTGEGECFGPVVYTLYKVEAPTPTPAPHGVRAKVVNVVDGDTIDVMINGQEFRVRYIGIDTPETKHPSKPVEFMGPEAAEANRRLVEGKTVELEKDVSETDRYGRLLRYVWVGDMMVNAELVRRGYAQVSTYPPDVKYQDLFVELQQEARAANRGLWAQPESTATPVPQPTQAKAPERGNCHPSYPDVCIPPPPPDLDCGDIPFCRFRVIGDDPHRFDGDNDGIGCERCH